MARSLIPHTPTDADLDRRDSYADAACDMGDADLLDLLLATDGDTWQHTILHQEILDRMEVGRADETGGFKR